MAKRRRRRHHRRRHHHRTFRRNPTGFNVGQFFGSTLVNAGIGAAGALTVDLLLGNLPIPQQYKTGMFLPVIRIASAVGLGMVFGAIGGPSVGAEVAAGGITVTMYQQIKSYMQQHTQLRFARYISLRGLGARRFARFGQRRRMRGFGVVRRRFGQGPRRRFARYVLPQGGQTIHRLNGLGNVRLGQRGRRRLGYVNPARTSLPPGFLRYQATR